MKRGEIRGKRGKKGCREGGEAGCRCRERVGAVWVGRGVPVVGPGPLSLRSFRTVAGWLGGPARGGAGVNRGRGRVAVNRCKRNRL